MINPYNIQVGKLVFFNLPTAYTPITGTIGCSYQREGHLYVTVSTRSNTFELKCEDVYSTFDDANNAKLESAHKFINENQFQEVGAI